MESYLRDATNLPNNHNIHQHQSQITNLLTEIKQQGDEYLLHFKTNLQESKIRLIDDLNSEKTKLTNFLEDVKSKNKYYNLITNLEYFLNSLGKSNLVNNLNFYETVNTLKSDFQCDFDSFLKSLCEQINVNIANTTTTTTTADNNNKINADLIELKTLVNILSKNFQDYQNNHQLFEQSVGDTRQQQNTNTANNVDISKLKTEILNDLSSQYNSIIDSVNNLNKKQHVDDIIVDDNADVTNNNNNINNTIKDVLKDSLNEYKNDIAEIKTLFNFMSGKIKDLTELPNNLKSNLPIDQLENHYKTILEHVKKLDTPHKFSDAEILNIKQEIVSTNDLIKTLVKNHNKESVLNKQQLIKQDLIIDESLKHIKDYNFEISEMKGLIDNLTRNINSLPMTSIPPNQMAELENKYNTILDELHELHELSSRQTTQDNHMFGDIINDTHFENIRKDVQLTNEYIKDLANEYKTLKNENIQNAKDFKNMINDLKKVNDTQKNEVHNLKIEFANLQENFKKTQESKKNDSENDAKTKSILKNLTTTCENLSNSFKNIISTQKIAENNILNLTEKIDKNAKGFLKMNIEENNKKISEIDKVLKNTNTEIAFLKKKIKSADKSINNLANDYNTIKKEKIDRADFTNIVENLNSINNAQKNEIENIQTKFAQLQENFTKTQILKPITDNTTDLNETKSTIKTLTVMYDNILSAQKKTDKEILALTNKIDTNENDFKKINEIDTTLKNTNSEIDNLKEKIKNTNENIINLANDYNTIKKDNFDHREFTNIISNLNSVNTTHKNEIDNLKKLYNSLQVDIDKTIKTNTRSSKLSNSKLEDLVTLFDDLRKNLDGVISTQKFTESDITNIKNKIDKSDEFYKNYENIDLAIKNTNIAIDSLKTKIDKINTFIGNFNVASDKLSEQKYVDNENMDFDPSNIKRKKSLENDSVESKTSKISFAEQKLPEKSDSDKIEAKITIKKPNNNNLYTLTSRENVNINNTNSKSTPINTTTSITNNREEEAEENYNVILPISEEKTKYKEEDENSGDSLKHRHKKIAVENKIPYPNEELPSYEEIIDHEETEALHGLLKTGTVKVVDSYNTDTTDKKEEVKKEKEEEVKKEEEDDFDINNDIGNTTDEEIEEIEMDSINNNNDNNKSAIFFEKTNELLAEKKRNKNNTEKSRKTKIKGTITNKNRHSDKKYKKNPETLTKDSNNNDKDQNMDLQLSSD